MQFHSYRLTEECFNTAVQSVANLCGLDAVQNFNIIELNVNRAVSIFNAEVCLYGQLDDDQYIDDDTLYSVIIPIATGFTQQWQKATTPHISSMSEGDGSVTFADTMYSTNIDDYKAYMRRYRRLRTVGGW